MSKLIGHPFAFILAATLVALALRLPELAQRPMHGDEAVHAIKFGALLEQGEYRYDSFEYHGPTLNYLTLIPAWLSSAKELTAVNEWTLRLVPVFFGTVLVFMTGLLCNGLGRAGSITAAILTAISPAMSYYSRYYIQEMLLVCFTFGVIACGYRYTQNRNFSWAIATGIFLGLMHATKETCIVAWGAMALALTLARQRKEGKAQNFVASLKALNRPHIIATLAVAGAVSALFYSSFFTNAQGVWDSILTYQTYFSRAGQNPMHIHPWHYYLNILAYFRNGANPVWSEALILVLAVCGFVVAVRVKSSDDVDAHLLRFLAFYTLFMTAIYSLIPYKTPWNLISFLHGMILLAGVGATAIVKKLIVPSARGVVLGLMVAAALHLTWLAYVTNYTYEENPANPYVYAHPVNDVFTIVKRVEEIAQAQPDKRALYMQVICPEDDYWPLPWYLRAYKNIGWWNRVDEVSPLAPLIIASPKLEPALLRKLYELPPPGQRALYVPLFDTYTELRPQIELRGYVRKDLWDRLQESVASDQ
jgi:uncharacterized protein (TIGR03663 family)